MGSIVKAALVAAVLCNTGCASWFMHGGELVGSGYQPNISTNYKAEGLVPAGVTYHLVSTPTGEATDGRKETSPEC